MNRTPSALSVLAVTGLLALTGCSSDSDGSATTTAPDTIVEVSTTGAPETTVRPERTTITAARIEDSTPVTVGPIEGPDTSQIVVSISATSSVITPDAVNCSGEKGNIRHIIAKTNNQPPLVEATPDFVWIKLDRSRATYRSEDPIGMTFDDTSVTFLDVTMGDAVVNGTLVCTDWED